MSKKEWKSKWKPFVEAREWARSSGIRTWEEWREAIRMGLKPSDIPKTPENVYKTEWQGWGDFLGSKWKPFVEAMKWARSSDIRDLGEWRKAILMGLIPSDIPKAPVIVYKTDWQGWKYFLRGGKHHRVWREKLSEAV